MDETKMKCPECGERCSRNSVHNGVMLLYGPWGCECGWSEDAEYSYSDKYDSRGGYTPSGGRSDSEVVGILQLALDQLAQWRGL